MITVVYIIVVVFMHGIACRVILVESSSVVSFTGSSIWLEREANGSISNSSVKRDEHILVRGGAIRPSL